MWSVTYLEFLRTEILGAAETAEGSFQVHSVEVEEDESL